MVFNINKTNNLQAYYFCFFNYCFLGIIKFGIFILRIRKKKKYINSKKLSILAPTNNATDPPNETITKNIHNIHIP